MFFGVLGPTLVTLGAILGLKSLYYGLKSHVHEIIWSLRTNLENYRKIDFYLMRGYAQCAALFNLNNLAGGVLEMWNSNLFYFTRMNYSHNF